MINNIEKLLSSVNQKLLKFFEENLITIIPEDKIIKLEPHIGEGSFGKVYKGLYNDNYVAIKKLKLVTNIDSNAESIIQEIKGVVKIKHQRIPTFHGVWKTSKYLHLIFDFIDGDTLTKFIPTLTLEEKLNISIQLVEIIEKLHDENLIHRDLKPGNIMIMKGKVYIIDFGLSKIAIHTQTGTKHRSGTLPYMGPENYIDVVDTTNTTQNFIKISTKFDIWSIGCILSYLFSKIQPWGDKTSETTIIMKLTLRKKFPIPDVIPKELKDILKHCFEIKIENRISAKELLPKLLELSEKKVFSNGNDGNHKK